MSIATQSATRESGSKAATEAFLIFRLSEESFGVPAGSVREMLILPKLIQVPATHKYERGVVDLRGQTVPVIDLMGRLGIRSSKEIWSEMAERLKAAQSRYRTTEAELTRAQENVSSFKPESTDRSSELTHWLADFKTDDPILRMKLQQIREPIEQYIQLADRFSNLGEEEAVSLIRHTASGLRGLPGRFEDTIDYVEKSHRELLLVLELDDGQLGFTVDDVNEIEMIPEEMISNLPVQSDAAIYRLARLKDSAIAQLIDPAFLRQHEL